MSYEELEKELQKETRYFRRLVKVCKGFQKELEYKEIALAERLEKVPELKKLKKNKDYLLYDSLVWDLGLQEGKKRTLLSVIATLECILRENPKEN